MPLKRFEGAGYSYLEVLGILEAILKEEDEIFKIGNEEINRQVEKSAPTYLFESNLGRDKEAYKKQNRKELLERLHTTEEDLRNNVFLRIKDASSLTKLKKILVAIGDYQKRPVQFLSGQTFIYQNQVLFFKLGDDTPDSIDFSAADELRKIFESFWELKKRTAKTNFEPQEVVSMYKELFDKDIERHYLASQISNLRTTKIKPKRLLRQRFKIDFDKASQSWIFILS